MYPTLCFCQVHVLQKQFCVDLSGYELRVCCVIKMLESHFRRAVLCFRNTFVLLYIFRQEASGCVAPKVYEQLKLLKDTDKRMSVLTLKSKNAS